MVPSKKRFAFAQEIALCTFAYHHEKSLLFGIVWLRTEKTDELVVILSELVVSFHIAGIGTKLCWLQYNLWFFLEKLNPNVFQNSIKSADQIQNMGVSSPLSMLHFRLFYIYSWFFYFSFLYLRSRLHCGVQVESVYNIPWAITKGFHRAHYALEAWVPPTVPAHVASLGSKEQGTPTKSLQKNFYFSCRFLRFILVLLKGLDIPGIFLRRTWRLVSSASPDWQHQFFIVAWFQSVENPSKPQENMFLNPSNSSMCSWLTVQVFFCTGDYLDS